MPDDPKPNENSTIQSTKRAVTNANQVMALAVELPLMFAGSVLIGGVIGYFLDRYLHTKPWLMLVFGTLGFIGGVRELLRRLPTK